MVEIERLVLACILVDGAEGLRLGPGFERRVLDQIVCEA
jgi:hypothetical protein